MAEAKKYLSSSLRYRNGDPREPLVGVLDVASGSTALGSHLTAADMLADVIRLITASGSRDNLQSEMCKKQPRAPGDPGPRTDLRPILLLSTSNIAKKENRSSGPYYSLKRSGFGVLPQFGLKYRFLLWQLEELGPGAAFHLCQTCPSLFSILLNPFYKHPPWYHGDLVEALVPAILDLINHSFLSDRLRLPLMISPQFMEQYCVRL